VAMRCSVLQCIIVCVLQYVSVCCDLLQCVAAAHIAAEKEQTNAEEAQAHSCVLQCVAVCCSVVRCVAIC